MKRYIIYFLLVLSTGLSAEILDSGSVISDTEIVKLRINYLLEQYKQFDEQEYKVDAIKSAVKYRKYSYNFFRYVFDNRDTYYINKSLETFINKKFGFRNLILKAFDFQNDTTIILGINSWFLLLDSDKDFIIEYCFEKNKYYEHIIPVIFTKPDKYKEYIRELLQNKDVNIRFTVYKYLVKSAPRFFDLTVLGMFDKDIYINRYVLSKYKLYPEQGKKFIYYALNSKKPSLIEMAKSIIKNNER